MTSLNDLSDDLVGLLLERLELEDMCRLSRVCRRFYGLVNSSCGDAAWQKLFSDMFGGTSAVALRQQQQQEQQSPQKKPRTSSQGASHFTDQQQQQQATALGQLPLPPPASARLHLLAAELSPSTQQPTAQQQATQQRPKQQPSAQQQATQQRLMQQQQRQQQGSWKERFKERYREERRQLRLKQRARVMKLESSVQLLSQEVHRLQQALGAEVARLQAAQQELASIQAERQAQAAHAISRQYWLPEAVQRAQGVVTSLTPVDLEGREADARQRLAVSELELRKLRNQLQRRRSRLGEERRRLAALQP